MRFHIADLEASHTGQAGIRSICENMHDVFFKIGIRKNISPMGPFFWSIVNTVLYMLEKRI
jgi:hypothetical protein